MLSLAVLLGVFALSLREQKSEVEKAMKDLVTARSLAEQERAHASALQADLEKQRAQIGRLEQEKEQVVQARQKIEQEMRGALESKDVAISELKGKLTVTILDRVLFNSGEAEINEDGQQILAKIATVLSRFPKRQVHVIGHTDNLPIRASSFARYTNNWELSTARATTAVKVLVEKAGVPPQRLGAVGYGEFHPIADNETPEGRARNRRIEIVVLPEELPELSAPAESDPDPVAQEANTPPPADEAKAPTGKTNEPAKPEPQPQPQPPAEPAK